MRTPFKPSTESTGAPSVRPVSDSLPVPAPHGALPIAPPAARGGLVHLADAGLSQTDDGPSADRTRPSRRSVVAVMAAGLIPVVPAIAAATPTLAACEHPDAQLLELGERYRHVCTLEVAADEAYEQACESVQEVERPDVLRHRLEDHIFDFGCFNLSFDDRSRPHEGFSADASLNPFYTPEEIRRLRYSPPPYDLAMIPAQKARIKEIQSAWKTHVDRFHAAEEAAGINEAQEAIDQVAIVKQTIVKEIAAVPAKTLAGLQVRAMTIAEIVEDTDDDDCNDNLMIAAIVRDLLS